MSEAALLPQEISAHDFALRHQALRDEVRAFLDEERRAGSIPFGRQGWTTWDRDFSIRCAERGFIAVTWPKRYGGREMSAAERYVICEEMLAAAAPLGSHWIAERQSGPQILRHGTDALKDEILPRIAAGRCTFGIGMSEPDSGSDLSSIRTRATRTDDGFRLTGRKIWTTNAHHAEYLIVLCRTEPKSENRHAGLSQLVVPMNQPGVTARPLRNLAGEEELNEVTFDDCHVPAQNLLGKGGDGWQLVTEELGFERSGPDRILSSFSTLAAAAEACDAAGDRHDAVELGRLVGRLVAIRQLSLETSARLARGEPATLLATMMKDAGTVLEQRIPDVVRGLLPLPPEPQGDEVSAALAYAVLTAPCFSLRGGTREILRGIAARGLGLR